MLISKLFRGSFPVDSLSKPGNCWRLLSQKTFHHEKKDKTDVELHLYAKHWKKLTRFRIENDLYFFFFFLSWKNTSSMNNTGSRLSFFFFDWNAAKHKEKRVFPPADRAPRRLTSHRAYLSSVLRRDALGFIPREKVAGSPVDQHTPLSLELCEKNARAVQEMQIGLLLTACTGYIYNMLLQREKTGCHVSYTRGTIYGSLYFYLGLSMHFDATEFYEIFYKRQCTACLFVSIFS